MARPESVNGSTVRPNRPGAESRLLAFASVFMSPDGAGISLFWRTFFLLAALIAGSVLAWLKTFQALEFEPRALQTAHQITSIVNITRATLTHVDVASKPLLIKTLADEEDLLIQPKSPTDVVAPPPTDELSQRILQELRRRAGASTVLSQKINGKDGIWVSFELGMEPFWVRIDPLRVSPVGDKIGRVWLLWLMLALVLSLAGAALLARLINKPIKQLWLAASRVREGDYDSSYLDETAATNEVREVNIGFNRMAARIAKMDQERAVMLAGISHDLRTPLARLRLETELSVSDEVSRAHMANDIEQLDRTIDKFLEYARPVPSHFKPVNLCEVVEGCLYALSNPSDMHVTVDVAKDLQVYGDATELGRVISNLLENARRYGKSADTGIAKVDISARRRDHWVVIRVRDRGPGVPPDILPLLTQAFFRGDSARTSAAGAGLGLSIVEKTVQRMGGTVSVTCPSSGGLAVALRLNKAS